VGAICPVFPKIQTELRNLFLSITFESQIKSDPLLFAVAFLRQVFAKNRRLREYNPTAFPQAFIPHKFERYGTKHRKLL
jgi:hypothetical protein